ncbi:hypothetical protein Tco_0309746 [Tanacetum coccineum]
MISTLDESRGINLAWVIAEHLCKHAPGLRENSLICGGHYVTEIAKSLGYFVDEEVAKCSEPIECEKWTSKMLASELDEENFTLLQSTQEPSLPRGARKQRHGINEVDDDLKKKLAKNNEAIMVLYNAFTKKEYERIFMCKMAKDIWQSLLITHQCNSQVKDNKIDLLVQQYEQFTILEEESIDSGFARFNTIITSLKALDEGFSSKNYVRKFLRALHPKWRAKVTTIEESKDLSSLALEELIGNLKVHEVVMEKDSKIYRGKKERVKSITLKAKKELLMEKYFRHPEAMTKNMLWPCGDPNHLIGDCPKPSRNKDQKAFIGGSWSDSKNDAETKTNEKRVSCSIANEKNS